MPQVMQNQKGEYCLRDVMVRKHLPQHETRMFVIMMYFQLRNNKRLKQLLIWKTNKRSARFIYSLGDQEPRAFICNW